MSFLIASIVFSIKQIWPFVMIGFLIGWWGTHHFQLEPDLSPEERKRRQKWKSFFQAFVVLLPGVVFLFGSHITSPLINYAGTDALAKVISQEQTSTLRNNQRVFKLNVIYPKANGELQESSFRTDEFNFYPSYKSGIYPKVGQEFKVKYLPSIPRYFVILQ
ncbi:hypothetical protein [Pelistega sp. MC2]|uniref:hypothetical protein n=1 Tax=Pelistega sp. MC2 TaxID=1720297 RepID=UPI0008DAFF1D|nr:hypothetical protein [Pelistega sp. MC2]